MRGSECLNAKTSVWLGIQCIAGFALRIYAAKQVPSCTDLYWMSLWRHWHVDSMSPSTAYTSLTLTRLTDPNINPKRANPPKPLTSRFAAGVTRDILECITVITTSWIDLNAKTSYWMECIYCMVRMHCIDLHLNQYAHKPLCIERWLGYWMHWLGDCTVCENVDGTLAISWIDLTRIVCVLNAKSLTWSVSLFKGLTRKMYWRRKGRSDLHWVLDARWMHWLGNCFADIYCKLNWIDSHALGLYHGHVTWDLEPIGCAVDALTWEGCFADICC